MAKQREQFKLHKKGKHSFLTPDRLEKLNSIGFVWSVRELSLKPTKPNKNIVAPDVKLEPGTMPVVDETNNIEVVDESNHTAVVDESNTISVVDAIMAKPMDAGQDGEVIKDAEQEESTETVAVADEPVPVSVSEGEMITI